MGALSLPASWISSGWAPAQPAPPRMVIFCAALRSLASPKISSGEGDTLGLGGGKCRSRVIREGLAQRDISRQGDDRHAPPRESRLDGDLQDPGHLLGLGHQLAIVAALREEVLRVGLLKVSAADLVAGDLRGDGEDRHPAAVAVVQAVDQVQIARTAAARADGQASGEMRFRARGEGRRLLVPHVNPPHALLPANRIGDSVQGVAGYAVDPLDSLGDQSIDEEIRDRLGHGTTRSFFSRRKGPSFGGGSRVRSHCSPGINRPGRADGPDPVDDGVPPVPA
jgi:hypothetical protein